jgi:hypothetical protein
MIEIEYGPQWFYVASIIIDLVTILVLFSIASAAIKYYKLNDNKNYSKLGFAFSLIAISFLFKMVTNFIVYYDFVKAQEIPQTIINTLETIKSFNIVANSSFLFFTLFNLAGLYALYSIKRGQSRQTVLLIIYFILLSTFISTLYSHSLYYIFHLTSLVFLILISSKYFNIYSRNQHKNTGYLAYSFSIIATSQAFFMFIALNQIIYVIAEIVQLIGYIILLSVLIRVLNYGKEKKQA